MPLLNMWLINHLSYLPFWWTTPMLVFLRLRLVLWVFKDGFGPLAASQTHNCHHRFKGEIFIFLHDITSCTNLFLYRSHFSCSYYYVWCILNIFKILWRICSCFDSYVFPNYLVLAIVMKHFRLELLLIVSLHVTGYPLSLRYAWCTGQTSAFVLLQWQLRSPLWSTIVSSLATVIIHVARVWNAAWFYTGQQSLPFDCVWFLMENEPMTRSSFSDQHKIQKNKILHLRRA